MSRDTQPRLGVATIVIVREPADSPSTRPDRIVLGKRARGGNVGKWVLPGGGVKLGEHWRDAGVREFEEETGLAIKIDEDVMAVMEFIDEPGVVAQVRAIEDKQPPPTKSHRVCLVAWGELVGDLSSMRASDELSEVRAFEWDDVPWDDVSPKVREVLEFYRPPPWQKLQVECAICHSKYPCAAPPKEGEKPTQGYGCAASIRFYEKLGNVPFNAWLLVGHYGSRTIDMDAFVLKAEPKEMFKNADPICDNCVQPLIDSGLAEKASEP